MTHRLELNAFEAVRRLVHLKKDHDRHSTERVALEHDIGIAVTKIERLRQPQRSCSKLARQCVRGFAPVGCVE